MSDAPAILQAGADRVNAALRELIDEQRPNCPPRIIDAVAYSLEAGGKRLRPTLVLAGCRAVGGDDAAALPAAVAIELIHTFSLVHDDLPAMDDDALRRGKPTNHTVFGEALAILAGDAMVTLAFEVLAEHSHAADLVRELAVATGPAGMIGGQVLDITSENVVLDLDGLQGIHRRKTGALLTASCRMGAICGEASRSDRDALTRFGDHIGLAFQIMDDVLDATATTGQMGKATGKDAAHGKNTYPVLLGLDGARAAAEQERDTALSALSPLGDAARDLATLAWFVTDRQR